MISNSGKSHGENKTGDNINQYSYFRVPCNMGVGGGKGSFHGAER